MNKNHILGHILAFITIFIWGTTFISTKVLLEYFSPEAILFYRFFIALVILFIFFPSNIKSTSMKEELLFFALGLSGVCLYYWTENLALQYTLASNVGLIVSSIPIFTAILAHVITKDEKFSFHLILGFCTAMIGIAFIIYNGRVLKLNPLGDLLALASAVLFAIYSILIKKVSNTHNQILVVKKTFFYGFLSILPIILLTDIHGLKIPKLNLGIILNLLFLSIFASILCFIMWNKAVRIIGSIKTTNYIYFVPLITMVSSMIVLKEQVNGIMILGGVLIFLGVYVNESNWIRKRFKAMERF